MKIQEFRPARQATQLATLLLLALIPALGLFRIDLASADLLIAGQAVNLRNFPVVAGLALVLATAPLLLVTTIGTLWCGWACPQNALSEWANRLTHNRLGSRANVNVESAGIQVAPSKNKAANWIFLALAFLAASLVLGIVPLFYFFPPGVVWTLVSFGEDTQFSHFLHRLYLVGVAAAFVDIALVRYFLCNYVCLYRIGLLLFKRKDALHVGYDAQRAQECTKCNYCRVSCITSIDPTKIKPFDRCINCGECIDACARLHAKNGARLPGLLNFVPAPAILGAGAANAIKAVLARLGWHGALFAAGCALLAIGLAHPGR